jgi:hypothetical protein
MAVNQIIFDPITQRTKSILIDIEAAMVQWDEDGDLDLYIKLTTTAKKLNGDSIRAEIIRGLTDMVVGGVGGKKRDGVTSGPYTDITDAITDYILFMVEGGYWSILFINLLFLPR